MIVPPTGVRVMIATKPVDFRKGMDGLAAYVEQQLVADPFSGVIYVFRAKRADKVKLLFWDGTGICLVTKRLEGAKFCWPAIADGVMRLSPALRARSRRGSCRAPSRRRYGCAAGRRLRRLQEARRSRA